MNKAKIWAEAVSDCLSKVEGEANNDSMKVHLEFIDELVRVNPVPCFQSGYLKLKVSHTCHIAMSQFSLRSLLLFAIMFSLCLRVSISVQDYAEVARKLSEKVDSALSSSPTVCHYKLHYFTT